MAKVSFRGDDKVAHDVYWKGFRDELISLYGEEAQSNKQKKNLIRGQAVPLPVTKPQDDEDSK